MPTSNSESPFSRLFHTNYVPSSKERSHISELIATQQHKVRALEAKIALVQTKLTQTKTKRDGLNDIITEHRRLLTPFRRIPDKILCAIFIHCLPAQQNAHLSIFEPPLLLSYVCKRWRRVAFDTPFLWATLNIAHIAPSEDSDSTLNSTQMETEDQLISRPVQSHLHAIVQWLNRSGSSPLSISVNSLVHPFESYLQTLLLFSHRWFNIRVVVNDISTAIPLSYLSPDDVPMLEVLHLRFSDWEWAKRAPLSWNTRGGILNAKNLHTLSVHCFPTNLAKMTFDWSHLTNLTLCDLSTERLRLTPSEACMVLIRCKNLIHLTMTICDRPAPPLRLPFPPSVEPHFDLLHLQTLSVYDLYYFTDMLFRRISAPSLHRVSYSTPFWSSRKRRSPLLALLFRNGRTVRNLTIDPRRLSHEELVECCGMTPFLSCLSCRNSEISLSVGQQEQLSQLQGTLTKTPMVDVLRLLTPSNNGQCYWPRMQFFSCNKDSRYARAIEVLDEADVLSFIQRRMKAAASATSAIEILSLKEVDIALGCYKKLDIVLLLQKYVQEGLQLKLADYREEIDYSSDAYPSKFCHRAGIKSLRRKSSWDIHHHHVDVVLD